MFSYACCNLTMYLLHENMIESTPSDMNYAVGDDPKDEGHKLKSPEVLLFIPINLWTATTHSEQRTHKIVIFWYDI